VVRVGACSRPPGPAARDRRSGGLYGPPADAYPDNLERFAFLSRGALELVKALGWIPDVIHAHDWPAALVPVYVDTVEWAQPLHRSATVYTIHNLAHQGVYDAGALAVTGLGFEHYNAREFAVRH
jgi:starch synthase